MQCSRVLARRCLSLNISEPIGRPRTFSSLQTRLAAKSSFGKATSHPPFPVIPNCPEPTCGCAATPEGLDIDHTKNIHDTIAPYSEHVIVSTGQSDWKSKIEDEGDTAGWGAFIRALKKDVGPRGQYHDPYNNVLISASSFQHSNTPAGGGFQVEALLFPSFRRVLVGTGEMSRHALVKSHLLRQLGGRGVSNASENEVAKTLVKENPVHNPTILICSHMTRDKRCGILGPLLRDEFANYLTSRGFEVKTGSGTSEDGVAGVDAPLTVNIGLISHIGGHRWAGNVIIYTPPTWQRPNQTGEGHELAGTGIWYGRVEPKHVEGVVEETLVKGNIIRDLLRGAIKQKVGIVRL